MFHFLWQPLWWLLYIYVLWRPWTCQPIKFICDFPEAWCSGWGYILKSGMVRWWGGEVVRWWGGGEGINDKAEPGKWSLKWSTHPELVTWISERMYHIGLGQFYEKKTQIPRTDVSYAKCHYQSTETGLLDLWHFPLFICTWDLYYWNWKPLQVSLCPDQDYSL